MLPRWGVISHAFDVMSSWNLLAKNSPPNTLDNRQHCSLQNIVSRNTSCHLFNDDKTGYVFHPYTGFGSHRTRFDATKINIHLPKFLIFTEENAHLKRRAQNECWMHGLRMECSDTHPRIWRLLPAWFESACTFCNITFVDFECCFGNWEIRALVLIHVKYPEWKH